MIFKKKIVFLVKMIFKNNHFLSKGKMTHSFLAKPFIDPAIMYGRIEAPDVAEHW